VTLSEEPAICPVCGSSDVVAGECNACAELEDKASRHTANSTSASCFKDFEVLVVRARVAAGTSWDGEDGGHRNRTRSQEPEVRNILRDCANAIERLARSNNSLAESLDNVREALGQEATHHLVMADDVKELVKAVESCAGDGGCRALLVLQKLRGRDR
jgi:hypothetical protein